MSPDACVCPVAAGGGRRVGSERLRPSASMALAAAACVGFGVALVIRPLGVIGRLVLEWVGCPRLDCTSGEFRSVVASPPFGWGCVGLVSNAGRGSRLVGPCGCAWARSRGSGVSVPRRGLPG